MVGSLCHVRRSRAIGAAVVGVVLCLVGGLLSAPPAVAAPAAVSKAPVPDPGPSVAHVTVVPSHVTKPANPTKPFHATATAWPKAGAAQVTLTGPAIGQNSGPAVPAATVPVWAQAVGGGKGGYAGPPQLGVRVLDHAAATAAGVNGVLLAVTPAGGGSGSVRVGVDYSGFAQAYGGDYGQRLRLVRLPGCALSTPSLPACRTAAPLVGVSNNTRQQTVSGQLAVTGTATATPSATASSATASAASSVVVLAATASSSSAEGGPSGTYAATTLKPSGSWTAGGSTGSFDYTYPITVPPAASSLVPQVALGYDSSSVDGQTASSQAQSSWLGDGWSSPRSFIEQSFISCADKPEGTASPVSTSDMCYDGPVLTLSLDGSTTSLVWDSTKSVWKTQADSGDVISHVTGSGNGSGTYNTDYWAVTERDGTVFQFGRNQLPGWAGGKATTNSVDSEPVYSAHSGDPCYNSSGFTASVCTMAYRWNLDYVKDVHGNAMAYYYAQDSNFYGQDNDASTVAYVRDSHLDHIDYGFTDGNAYATPPDRVVFGTGSRCVSGTCTPLNSSTAANWPDVPYDLYCPTTSWCSSPLPSGPSFFSTVRLTSITAQQYSTTSSAYVAVDSYALTQTIPANGDGTSSPTLWLASVTRTGSDTTAGGSTTGITVPTVTFTPTAAMQNRTDTTVATGGLPGLDRYRLGAITTETGSVITVGYGQTAPCATPVSITPSANTSSCYPVYWTPTGYSNPILDWFNKYVVTKVTQTDPTGGAAATATSYVYQGGTAWHYDDNEVVQPKYRTYGQFRGYAKVQTLGGDGVNDPQTLSDTTYYRGMSKNNNTTVVNLTDSAGGAHEDLNPLAGNTLETTAYLGNGGPADHSTITAYWVSAATATRTRSGLPDLTANWAQTAETYTRQALTDGGTTTWRYTETDNSYDAAVTDTLVGQLTHSYTHTVPVTAADDRCSTPTYAAANTSANLVGLLAETETDSVACGGFTEGTPASLPASGNNLTTPASVSRPAQVVSDTRTFYDDTTYATTFPQAAAPTKGDVTMSRAASTWASGAFTYQSTTRAAYDSYGRPTAAYDGNGNKTSTAYTMNAVGLTTATSLTNPLTQSVNTTLDPERGLTLTSTDPNGVRTTQQYDALGRATSVWLNSRATTSSANYTYAYQISNGSTTTSAVTTKRLLDGGGYLSSITIYDGQLRTRQTQTDTVQGGRMVTDTLYDSRGWTRATYNGWWDPNTTPNTTTIAPSQVTNSTVPNQDYYTHDGLGRVVVDTSDSNNTVVSTTTTVYNGDRTTTIAPTGGITQATVTDPLGRTSELDQYTTAPTVTTPANTFTGIWYLTGGVTTATGYGYDGHGNQNTVTDAQNHTWTSTYNLLGQVTAKTAPDAGASSMLYDGDGNLTQSTDSRSKTISFAYDALNRKTGEYDSAVGAQSAGNQLAAWAYDNSNSAVTGMTYPIGHLTTSTAYSGGAAYTTQAKGFNVFGEPLGETVTIPSATEGSVLGISYTFSHIYTAATGLPLKDIYPAAGGLPGETLLRAYNGMDMPKTLGGLTGYVQNVSYDAFNRVNQETIGTATGNQLGYLTNTWDPHTGRLTDQLLTRANATPTNVDEQAYTYDLAGNITRQTSTRLGAATPTETQCYTYDTLDRLGAAWTATDACAATPTTSNHTTVGDTLGAASTYWTTWIFDTLGQRTNQVQHNLTGGSDTTTTYTYGNTTQPHTLTATNTTGATTTYNYDTAGNTTTRNAAQGNQTLTWNDADQLTTITGSTTGNSSYEYDANGTLLIQKDPSKTTLYLPGEQIILDTTSGTTTGTRYIPLPGGGTVVRTSTATTAFQFEITDQHGTPTVYLDNTAQTPTWRQYNPYGEARGAGASWPDNHGFLNKVADSSTGLTEVGARNYDPALGRFISLDPVFEAGTPQQLNGYTYSADNPVTNADPTGLEPGSWCDTSDCAVLNGQSQTSYPMEQNHDKHGYYHHKKAPNISAAVYASAYVRDHHLNCTYAYAGASACSPQDGFAGQVFNDASALYTWAHSRLGYVPNLNCHVCEAEQQRTGAAFKFLGHLIWDLTAGTFVGCARGSASDCGYALAGVIGTGDLGGILKGISLATRLSDAEKATAGLLVLDSSYTGGKLSESADVAYDFVDQYGRTYDALGQPKAYKYWSQREFLNALDGHVRKQGLDFTVLDLSGANSSQLDAIFSHIDQMTPAQQASIVIVGG
jgi:RHS repeat-associated protein